MKPQKQTMNMKHVLLVVLVCGISMPVYSAQRRAKADPIREELNKIQKEIENLKEKILEMKSQLLLLNEMFEKGTESGTMLSLNVKSEMPEGYKIRSLNVFVNGYQVYSSQSPAVGKNIYLESVAPGNFRIEVIAEVTGKKGIFRRKKNVTVNGDRVVSVEKGLTSDVDIIFQLQKDNPVILFQVKRKKTLPSVR